MHATAKLSPQNVGRFILNGWSNRAGKKLKLFLNVAAVC